MKHWTEPQGRFIINIPIEWQYKNVVVENGVAISPYSFEPYEDSLGCFQLSCYPLEEKGVNPNFEIQKNNTRIEWHESGIGDNEFDILLYFAQVDDLLCMAKYIYSIEHRNDVRIGEQLKKVKDVLETVRVIPQQQRELAANLDKHDNFIASLAASYDLLEKAYESESYIELVVILANQIDAFLRSAIILKEQLEKQTNDIEVKYLFQAEGDRGIVERAIYNKAFELKIIDTEIFKELNDLYDLRNRVIHRYIISFLKTRDIVKIAYEYSILNEKVRVILKSYEEMQFGKGFGIYGDRYSKEREFDKQDYKRAYAMVNDKHLIERLKRKI